MKKIFLMALAAVFAFPSGAQANMPEEVVERLPMMKPIERSYDLEHLRARRPRARRAWWLYDPFKEASTTQSRINDEEPGADDVLAPGEPVYQDLHFKNRRRKAFLNNKRAYSQMYQKPSLSASRRWVKPGRRNRPRPYTLDSERSGAEKLRKLLFGE